MTDRFDRLAKNVVLSLLILLTGLLICINVISSCYIDKNEHAYYVFHSVFPVLIAEAILFGLFFACIKIKIKIKHTFKFNLKLLLLFAFICGCCFVIGMGIQPRADQRLCLQIAQDMHKGNYEAFTKEGYLQTYPQQAGLILFYYFVSFLLGSSTVLGLQIINVFAYVCFIYCIYHIALLLWKNTTIAAFSGVLTFSFLPLLFYTTFVYGTLIGLALSTLSILKALEFIRKQKVSSAIFCSIFAGCSVVIKKNYIIAVVAIVLVLLVYGIVKRHWSLFICSLLLLIATLSFTKITSMAMESISGCTLGDGMPSITWVTMGLQEGYRADGWYNRYTINTFVDNDFDPIATKQQAKKDLHNELSKFLHNKQYAVSFFYKKTASQWCEPTFQSLYINKVYSSYGERKFTTPPFIMSLIVKVLLPALDLFLSIALIGVMMYLLYNREQIKLLELLPGIVFLGGFLFHLFWEAKGQYTITYFVLLFPYCVKGYSCIYKRIEEVLLDQSHKDIASRWRSIACIYHAIRPVTRLLIVLLIFNIITLVVPSVKATTNRFDQTYYTYLYNSGSEKKKSKVPTGKFIISTFDKKGYLDFSLKKPDRTPTIYLNEKKAESCAVIIQKKDKHVSFKFAKASSSFDDFDLPKINEKDVKKAKLFYYKKADWSFQKMDDNSYIITNPDGFVLSRTEDNTIVYEPYDKKNNLQKWKLHRIHK